MQRGSGVRCNFAAGTSRYYATMAASFHKFANPGRFLRLTGRLLPWLAGVTATAYAWTGGRGGWRPFVTAVAIGVAAWAAAETLYVVLHAAQGERFDAERFGPQWRQALGLIGVHAVVLGAPTGIVAGVLLQANAALRRR